MKLNYQDQILQMAEAITTDIIANNDIIGKEKEQILKQKLVNSILPFVNNYLTDLYVKTEEIGFGDLEQIAEFETELDINLHLIKLEYLGVIGSANEDGHFYLTDKGKTITEEYIFNKKSEEE